MERRRSTRHSRCARIADKSCRDPPRPVPRRASAAGDDQKGTAMQKGLSRRAVLEGSTALGLTMFASPIRAAPPTPEAIMPALIEAAKKEGKLAFYTAMDLAFAERLGKAFEENYGITV